VRVGHVHLRHLNPLPRNLGEVLKRYRKVVVPEMNMGQLVWVLRAKYLIDAQGFNKIQGKPFKVSEIEAMIEALESGWSLSREEAAFVAEVAVAEVTPEMDYYRLTRQFFSTTSDEERARFLDVLFSIAVADGSASNAEIEEIRAIARALKLTHQQFIDAKLKVPRESRET